MSSKLLKQADQFLQDAKEIAEAPPTIRSVPPSKPNKDFSIAKGIRDIFKHKGLRTGKVHMHPEKNFSMFNLLDGDDAEFASAAKIVQSMFSVPVFSSDKSIEWQIKGAKILLLRREDKNILIVKEN